MLGYLKRLVTTGAAYQFGDILAKGLALLTVPLYTRHLDTKAYGAAETLLTAVILASILLRVGVGEAFIRFYFDDDDQERRARIARTATATVAWTTTLASLLALVFAGPLSRLVLKFEDPLLFDTAVLGLWAFTNLEMAYAQLRVDERARTYVYASGANVAMTVVFTVSLVVFANQGARGLLLGNFGASALVVLGLWWVLRRRVSLRVRISDLRAMLRFGLPTVPADASVYALQVADRLYLYRAFSQSAAGQYAIAIKLATVVFVAVRGFQYAWPPLAYSIDSDEEAARLYSVVTTYYALATGVVVCAVELVGRWIVHLLAGKPEYFGAYRALPWLALGWALYGLYLVFVAMAGRARVTSRNYPAGVAGLAVNVALLLVLVPKSGAGLGIAGAGIALCGAYATMLVVMYALTRKLFQVGFEWLRLAQLTAILAGVAVSGELLLPRHGFAGLALRVAWLALVPAALMLTRFFHAHELAQARVLVADGRRRVAAFRAGHGELEAYAEDPLRDV
ncbi:MAG TPA: lipopolysaccharide biosynthesis protein [Solirubrobacteraceae bacterium]|nr:lipopolysaccharide biosynthesis protein [Solirubrobacteraceae bacterium]